MGDAMAGLSGTLGTAAARVRWTAVLRSPLVHFLLIGTLLFAGLQTIRETRQPTVELSEAELDQLVAYWRLHSGREPSKAELRAILQERIDEELLAAEARRLGLDRDDMIVRRRLAQKMAFASEDLAGLEEPAEAVLRSHYEQNLADYGAPGRAALRQVFFSADRGKDAAAAAARQALARTRAGQPLGGDPFLLPLSYADVSAADLVRDYGEEFTRAVHAAPVGEWAGPIPSPYGYHLVEVLSRSGAQTQRFEQVRDEVRESWLAEQRARNNAEFVNSLRKRYRVVVPGLEP